MTPCSSRRLMMIAIIFLVSFEVQANASHDKDRSGGKVKKAYITGITNPDGKRTGACTNGAECQSGLCYGGFCCESRTRNKNSCDLCNEYGTCKKCAEDFKLSEDSVCERLKYCTWTDVAQYQGKRAFKSPLLEGVDLSACNELVIKPNSLNQVSAQTLSEALKSTNCTLKRLVIKARNPIGVKGIQALAYAFEAHEYLEELDLSIRIGSNLKYLVTALEQNHVIKILRLTGSHIDVGSVNSLAQTVGKRQILQELSLVSQQDLGKSITSLKNMILNNRRLHILDLSENNMNDTATSTLAAALSSSSIQKLVLNGNKISNHGVKALATVIEKRTPLTALYLSDNMIGDVGATVLASAIKKANITEVSLARNKIKREGMQELKDTLSEVKSLTKFDVRGNLYSGKILKDIRSTLRARRTTKPDRSDKTKSLRR